MENIHQLDRNSPFSEDNLHPNVCSVFPPLEVETDQDAGKKIQI